MIAPRAEPDAVASVRERGKSARRQRIFDAALAILRDDGLEGLTTARIASLAGLSVATLYNLIGGLDAILDALVVQAFEGVEEALREPPPIDSPAPAIEGFVEATYRYLAPREASLRAVQRAVFQRSLAAGASSPVMHTAARSVAALERALRALQAGNRLAADADPRLIAGQMVLCQTMLLENWSVGIVSLEHYRLAARYHLLMLLRAWATARSRAALDAALRERQRELAALVRGRGKGRNDKRGEAAG